MADPLWLMTAVTVAAVTLFNFTNGFHDAADMVATAIASRAMRSETAIGIVLVFTFLGPFLAGLAVADTVGTFVELSGVGALRAQSIVAGALMAAITYNLLTWRLGYPSSSSNSLAGGLVGAGLGLLGNDAIHWGIQALSEGRFEGVVKVVAGLFLSPVFGFIAGYFIMKLILWLFRRATARVRALFVASQYVSIAWLGFSHGANDAQKGMAVIGMMLLAGGYSEQFVIPLWAVLLCTTAITVGTMFGGWNIIKTMGFGIYRIRVVHAVANQVGSALVNTVATALGAPTSTTQVVTATLLGNGAAEKPAHVRWRTAAGIVAGWFMNVPASMLLGAFYAWLLVTLLGG